jgi:DNA-binding LytR/AlgR family response regulator
LRALVVDDEPVARSRLKRLLERSGQVEVVGEAADAQEALERLGAQAPDVVFLDIRMPGMDGLELARRLPEGTHVVFTTAYDEYALQAFDAAAVDYLLKPVESARLAAALDKLRRIRAPDARPELERLLSELAMRRQAPRIAARQGDRLRVFDPRAISRFHAEDRYTAFHHQGRQYLLEESLAALEERLASWGFLRVHRGELVNLHQVVALKKEDDATLVELTDGQRAVVSRRYLRTLKERLGIPDR